MAGVAEKVVKVPAQTGFADDEIDKLTGKLGLTVIDNVFDVAGLPTAQTALEVNRQWIASAFKGT